MSRYLMIDFGSTFTKLTAVDTEKEDIIATLTAFTAESIVDSYKKHVIPKVNLKKVIIGGGGAHNKTLLNFIQKGLDGIQVLTQEDVGYSSDAKEAIAFAILGNETLHGNPSNMPSATGAKAHVILGNITPKPKRKSPC